MMEGGILRDFEGMTVPAQRELQRPAVPVVKARSVGGRRCNSFMIVAGGARGPERSKVLLTVEAELVVLQLIVSLAAMSTFQRCDFD